MYHYSAVFLIIALISAIFGFGGIADGATGIAKILFFIFVVMSVITFVITLLTSHARRQKPRDWRNGDHDQGPGRGMSTAPTLVLS